MTKIIWNRAESQTYENGIDRGVFFPQNSPGVPWNGLVNVKEAPSGSDILENYQDGQKYISKRPSEGFSGTIEAFTYPDEFIEYDGVKNHLVTSQNRKYFGLSYRTRLGGNSSKNMGYKLHLVYNAFIYATSEKNYNTLNDGSDLTNFSWEFTTLPIRMTESKLSSHLVIDSTKARPWAMDAIENVLYGDEGLVPTLPDPDEVIELFENNAVLRVTDNNDGTWTAEGPEDAISMVDSNTFEITWESALYIDDHIYSISSY